MPWDTDKQRSEETLSDDSLPSFAAMMTAHDKLMEGERGVKQSFQQTDGLQVLSMLSQQSAWLSWPSETGLRYPFTKGYVLIDMSVTVSNIQG